MKPLNTLVALCCAACIAHADDSNVVWLTLRDHSFNPITLSLDWKDAVFSEVSPSGRQVATIAHGDISLVFWRLLLLGEVYFDDFTISGVNLSLIRHANKAITPLTDPHATNVELRLNASGSTNAFTKKDASRKKAENAAKKRGVEIDENTSPALIIPDLILTNINVACIDEATGKRVWSYERAWFMARNFRMPLLDNDDLFQIACGAFFDGSTATWCSVNVAMRTALADPTFHLQATAAHIRLEHPWLAKDGMPGQPTNKPSASWFDQCYSNACDLLVEGIDHASKSFIRDATVSNFFKVGGKTNVTASIWADVSISNRMLMPGVIDIALERHGSSTTVLKLQYAITNAPPWVQGRVLATD